MTVYPINFMVTYQATAVTRQVGVSQILTHALTIAGCYLQPQTPNTRRPQNIHQRVTVVPAHTHL